MQTCYIKILFFIGSETKKIDIIDKFNTITFI